MLLEWGGEVAVEAAGGAAAAAPQAQAPSYDDGPGGSGSGSDGEEGRASGGSISGSMTSSYDDSMELLPKWEGKQLRFMQSNEHTRRALLAGWR